MTLHPREQVRHALHESVYPGQDLSKEMPKYRFPQAESEPGVAFQVVKDELMLDGNARQNLATWAYRLSVGQKASPAGADEALVEARSSRAA